MPEKVKQKIRQMKRVLNLLGIALLMVVISGPSFAGNYKVSKDESKVKWTGKKVAGEHYGTINFKSGSLDVKDGVIKGGSFEIDMTSMVCDDLKDKEWNQKLIGHLKSDDFFSVDKFPSSSMVLKKVVEKGGGEYEFTGHLTIKGMTHPVVFMAKVEDSGSKLVAKGKAKIDRTLYDIKYGSGKFFSDLGDRMINDHFVLEFKLVADKS